MEYRVRSLPDQPGVYLFKDGEGQVIYVGKATSLKSRVRSYFVGQRPPRTEVMVRRAVDLEYILTDSEVEALILECNLIKRHRPYFNINLKDDKSYPYLKVTLQEDFPRVQVTRQQVTDGARYFGPYVSAGALKETVRLLRALFPVRTCKETPLKPKSRACLNAHIGRCLGPCAGLVSQEDYRCAMEAVVLFLEGKRDFLVKELKSQMQAAAGQCQFERAAVLRDQLRAIGEVLARQRVARDQGGDLDAVALASGAEAAVGLALQVRAGKVIGSEHFFLTGTIDQPPPAVMAALLKQYYSDRADIPPAILLQHEPEDREIITQWLRQARGGAVRLIAPQRGEKLELVRMAAQNAAEILSQHQEAARRKEAAGAAALLELQRLLNLPGLPRRIEAYDISHHQGANQVGSMVVFLDGAPKTSAYRRFTIKTLDGADDYAALQEVLVRRFKRAGDTRFAADPDLILIDGGRGQLNAALAVLASLGVADLPAISLAKEEEQVFTPHRSEPLALARDNPGLKLLQHLRDEAHRFAVTYHRERRAKSVTSSELDEIPGIGRQRKTALLRHFGSLAAISRAGLAELLQVPGLDRRAAAAVLRHFGGGSHASED